MGVPVTLSTTVRSKSNETVRMLTWVDLNLSRHNLSFDFVRDNSNVNKQVKRVHI